MNLPLNNIVNGDASSVLSQFPDQSVNCIVTSPPYFGLRDYGVKGQLGLEDSVEVYVQKMVTIFREAHRVLKNDGTLWLNLGDSYSNDKIGNTETKKNKRVVTQGFRKPKSGLPHKNLIGVPWRVAFALQADGWYLRQDIIWAKSNPMPESVLDRCTKSHEYIFLLSKSPRYYFDSKAIKEPLAASSIARLSQNVSNQIGSKRVPGKTNGPMKAVMFGGNKYGNNKDVKHRTKSGKTWNPDYAGGGTNLPGHSGNRKPDGTSFDYVLSGRRNKRSVWTVSTKPFKEAHFATFPQDLIEPMILAGCPQGGVCLDPFMGAGTTAIVAKKLGRNYVGIELNPKYIAISKKRLLVSKK